MNIKFAKVSEIRTNDANPRNIQRKKYKQLMNSLLVFPAMLELRPIVVDADMKALGGNQRAHALQQISTLTLSEIERELESSHDFQRYKPEKRQAVLSFWERFLKEPEVIVADASSLSPEETDQFIIKDNANYGAWDWNKLANEWDALSLNEWGLDIWGADEDYGTATQSDAGADDNSQNDESPKSGSESTKDKQLTICIIINDKTQYEQIVASVELAVADYDVTLR